MGLRGVLVLLLILPLGGCALFRRPMVEVERPRVELEGGVEFEDVVVGVGRPAELSDEVTLDYSGWLEDGTPFDSSVQRGVPITFVLAEAPLAGWRDAIPGMRAGGKRRLLLPPGRAYGALGVPGLVPPDSALVFLIELWSIEGEVPPALPPRSQRLGAPPLDDDWDDD